MPQIPGTGRSRNTHLRSPRTSHEDSSFDWTRGAAGLAQQIVVDSVKDEVPVDRVVNAKATVVIDSTGIAVLNGKITVTNPGGTVIIDGTSNIFKIAANGSQSCTIPDTLYGTSATTTLSGLTYSAVPLVVFHHSLTGSAMLGNIGSNVSSWTGGSGGVTDLIRAWGEVSGFGSGHPTLKIYAQRNTNTGTLTRYQYYYCLVEATL